MRSFFSKLSGKEAPSALDVGVGAAGLALGSLKRGAHNVASVFKKQEQTVQSDSFTVFKSAIENIHSVVVHLSSKTMECSHLQQSQVALQHAAQHVQARKARAAARILQFLT